MNEYSLNYLRSIADTDLQKRIVELISENLPYDEIIKILIHELEAIE